LQGPHTAAPTAKAEPMESDDDGSISIVSQPRGYKDGENFEVIYDVVGRFLDKGAPAAPCLRHLRLRDIIQLYSASRSFRRFTTSAESGKLLVPTFTYRHNWAEMVALSNVEVMYADDAKIVTLSQNADFAGHLRTCASLRELYCSHNQRLITAMFANGIAKLSNLVVFDASHNRLAVDDHRSFEREQSLGSFLAALPPKLRVLDLSYNLLRDQHAHQLVDALEASEEAAGSSCLEELVMRSNYLGNGAGFAFAQLMRGPAGHCLCRLDMRTNQVEADGACAMLSALQAHPRMKEMRVGYNKQNTKQDIETAKFASVLLRRALSEKSKNMLEVLDLNNVRIGDSGVKQLSHALAMNNLLCRLYLAFNSIGPDGAEVLGVALETNACLRELDLRDNGIGDDGAASLSVSLQKNFALRKLQLARNGIRQRGALSLMGAVRENGDLLIDFGASGEGSAKLQSMMSRTVSMANLSFVREAEREVRFHAAEDGLTSLMFSY